MGTAIAIQGQTSLYQSAELKLEYWVKVVLSFFGVCSEVVCDVLICLRINYETTQLCLWIISTYVLDRVLWGYSLESH